MSKLPSNSKLKKFFQNSIWIVPKSTLLAYATINGISKAVSDQTVWVIDSYEKGYIFGTSYTTLDGIPTSKTKIVGSIASNGNVLFSFYNANSNTKGNGNFVLNGCDRKNLPSWEFIMQMSDLSTTTQAIIGLTHWSYMIYINESYPNYHHLPGVNISVPEFISLFD